MRMTIKSNAFRPTSSIVSSSSASKAVRTAAAEAGNKVEASLILTGLIVSYGAVLWSRLTPRLRLLQSGRPLPAPYMDAVTYLTDAVPLIKVPRSVAERAVHRLIKSNYFKQQTRGIDPKVQRSFIDRLRAKMMGMPSRLSDIESKELDRYLQVKKFG